VRLRRPAIAALALACLFQGVDSAAADYPVRGRQLTRIELEGSDGYSVSIVSDRKQHLTLVTTKEGFTTEYSTHDTQAGPTGIRAEMPGLGSISIRLHSHGAVHRARQFAGCRGPRPTVQKGVARGVIEFTGEHGYTQVSTQEVPAEIEEWKRLRCHSGGGPDRRDIPGIEEWLSMFSGGAPEARFVARKYRPGVLNKESRALYLAETGERISRRPYVGVERRAVLVAASDTFADGHPEHIVVSPPPPFVGSATFSRTPESVFAWEGDLSIQFPGADPLPLAGPDADLKYCLRETGCIRQLPPPQDYPLD
jgi:hypothetical protein